MKCNSKTSHIFSFFLYDVNHDMFIIHKVDVIYILFTMLQPVNTLDMKASHIDVTVPMVCQIYGMPMVW